jgi:hypothetical protein
MPTAALLPALPTRQRRRRDCASRTAFNPPEHPDRSRSAENGGRQTGTRARKFVSGVREIMASQGSPPRRDSLS